MDEVFGKHSGLLTATLSQDEIDASDFRRSDSRFHGPELNRNLAQIDTLRSIADVMGATVGQLALAWLLGQGPDVVPLPGTRRPDRVRQNAAAADLCLAATELESIESTVPRAAWAGDRTSFAVPVTTRAR